ncbi:hypothetical protein M407DRAFT_9600 [Tulasnella calospora MUT 4182]|uniref:Uncharacterized protein n=1 Tax=Tulasnella calospora MUT 4182 TaxID=1051891 RepID=A0A0C3QDV7_9AGAM|nr:hypothetical protein M407DRAFT_9600 [Tulasnella calospora MUT 4182]
MSLMMNQAHIDQLPIETMSNIFLLAIRPIWPRQYRVTSALAKLAFIAAVSRRWRSVVDAAPELWSFLHSSDPIKITRIALEKSKDTSLTVTCIQYKYPESVENIVATRFIDCVKPHVARWRFVFFRVKSPVLSRIPSAAAPRLRRFTVYCQDDEYLLDNPFGGQAPQLRELACMCVALRWNLAPLLFGLSSLKIVLGQEEDLSIRCSELYAAIAKCPNLQSLIITQSSQRADDPLFLGNVPTLHFAYLTEIKLSTTSAFTNTILPRIKAPACNNFMAEAEVGLAELTDQLIPYLSQVINNQPIEAWKAEMYVEEEVIRFSITPAHKEWTVWRPFDLELFGGWIPTFVWIIDKLLPSITTRPLMILHFSPGCEFPESLLDHAFLRLPRVEHLTLEHNVNPELIWEWLAEPLDDGTGASQWLFPELRKLSIYGSQYDWDVLVETAHSRWGPAEDGDLDRPEPLEILRLLGGRLGEEQMESLKDVIGSENVTPEDSDHGTDSAESEWMADLLL